MAGRKRLDVDSETVLAVMQEEKSLERIKAEQQAEREQLIAQAHEAIGRVQANNLMAKFATVGSLVQLKNIKESKIYRDLPHVGTWDKYCEYLGLSRQKVDEDLQNLAAFGEEFLLMCRQFSLGYQDLRKLRQLTHDGTVTIDAEAVTIGGESIPLDQDHKEDLQAAIEKIIEEQAKAKEELAAQNKAFNRVQEDTRKTVAKLEKDLSRLEKTAKAKQLLPEEDAVLGKIDELNIILNGHALSLENVYDALQQNPFNAGVAAFITLCDNIIMRVRAFRETAVADLAPAGMLPDEEWVPPPLRADAE